MFYTKFHYPDDFGDCYINDSVPENRLLVYGDSFSWQRESRFLHYVSQNFSATQLICSHVTAQKDIDAFKPDTVVMQISERDINKMTKDFWRD